MSYTFLKPRKLPIIAIGEEEFVEAMKTAGITDVIVIDETKDAKKIVCEAFNKLVTQSAQGYGVILISTKIAELVRPIIDKLMPELMPLVLEVPGPRDLDKFDIKEFYSSIARKFIGFTIGLPEG